MTQYNSHIHFTIVSFYIYTGCIIIITLHLHLLNFNVHAYMLCAGGSKNNNNGVIWDVTVVCTCADSYVEASAREAGAASELSGVVVVVVVTFIQSGGHKTK